MNVGVLGAGYVGLVTAAGLAHAGHSVLCTDINADWIESLRAGSCPLREPGLPELLRDQQVRMQFAITTAEALIHADVILVCVGTPNRGGRPDLSALKSALEICKEAETLALRSIPVLIRSTILPGTTRGWVREILRKPAGFWPEFLREGSAVHDFLTPDRWVLGADDDETRLVSRRLTEFWSCPRHETNTATAEMIKYASNCLLAAQISLANDFAMAAEKLDGVDVVDVLSATLQDHRWQGAPIADYLVPGIGFGGSCLPKDLEAFNQWAREQGVPAGPLQAAEATNLERSAVLIAQIQKLCGGLEGKRVLQLGLAFKPNTRDMRSSSAVTLFHALRASGGLLTCHDPACEQNDEFPLYADWRSEALRADIIVLATAWPEYADLENMDAVLEGKIIVDGRRYLNPAKFQRACYWGPGRSLPENSIVPAPKFADNSEAL